MFRPRYCVQSLWREVSDARWLLQDAKSLFCHTVKLSNSYIPSSDEWRVLLVVALTCRPSYLHMLYKSWTKCLWMSLAIPWRLLIYPIWWSFDLKLSWAHHLFLDGAFFDYTKATLHAISATSILKSPSDPTTLSLRNTKMWCVMTIRRSYLEIEEYSMKVTCFLESDTALHDNSLWRRRSASFTMSSFVQCTQQVWCARVNLHTLLLPSLRRNLMISGAFFMLTIRLMLLLFQRKRHSLERMFYRKKMVSFCTLYSALD